MFALHTSGTPAPSPTRRTMSGMMEIGTQRFPRTKRFDMEERKTLVFNAKQRTIGVRAVPCLPVNLSL